MAVYFKPESILQLRDALERKLGPSSVGPDELIQIGAVYINGVRCLEDVVVSPADLIKVFNTPRRFAGSPEVSMSSVVFDHADFVVMNKPAGLPTVPTPDNRIENLLHLASLLFGQALFPCQRLDQLTSGLCVFGKTAKFHSHFQSLQKSHQIKKRYLALTETSAPLGLHEHFMTLQKKPPHQFTETEHPPHSKVCKLRILGGEPTELGFLNEVELITGRTHQIRGQLASLGHPLLGDPYYNQDSKAPFYLKAFDLEFGEHQFILPRLTDN